MGIYKSKYNCKNLVVISRIIICKLDPYFKGTKCYKSAACIIDKQASRYIQENLCENYIEIRSDK